MLNIMMQNNTTMKPLNQNNMKIEVVAEDKNIGTINCESMYQAHTWVVYLNANGFKCKTLVDGVLQNLPNDLQHPKTYSQIIKSE